MNWLSVILSLLHLGSLGSVWSAVSGVLSVVFESFEEDEINIFHSGLVTGVKALQDGKGIEDALTEVWNVVKNAEEGELSKEGELILEAILRSTAKKAASAPKS